MPGLAVSLIRRAVVLIAALVAAPVLRAEEFAERTVKIIAPFEPGGTVESAARVLAKWLNVK
jgi:tripartite-type tricarboxylate transporter receptor subunit TctC